MTGANRGIGLETCRQLLAHGMRVVLTGREPATLDLARHDLAPASGRAMTVRLDVTDVASIEAAREAVSAAFGPVDVLVNNAAVLVSEDAAVLSTPASAFRRTLDTNLLGAIEVCRVFVPPMAERGYGRVVNVSSGAGQLSRMTTYAPAYSISKAALNAFTRQLAASLRGSNVLVNAVDPGWVRTDMGGASAPRSVAEGAATIVWLAALPAGGPTGGFFRDRRELEW